MFVASRIRRSVIARTLSLGGSLSLIATPASAQEIDFSALGKQIEAALEKMMSQAASVSPSLTRIEDNRSSVTVTVTNPSNDTLDVELSVSAVAPLTAAAGLKTDGALGKGLLAESGGPENPKVDTIEAGRSMATWVKDLPPRLRLAPGEKRLLTLKLDIPSELQPGEYSVWVVAMTRFAELTASGETQGGGSQTITFGKKKQKTQKASPDEDFKFPRGAKLIYVAK